MLLLPIISFVTPDWHLSWIPNWTAQKTISQSSMVQNENSTAESTRENGPILPAEVHTESMNTQPEREGMTSQDTTQSHSLIFHWKTLAIILWFTGLLFMIIRYLVGRIVVWRMTKRALPMTEPAWLQLTKSIQKQYGITRPIRFLWSDKTSMPMTWGIHRPCVILPLGAKSWPLERQRFIILHELAHIKRWDALTQLLAQWAGAIYWFHPLIWISKQQCLKEREHACDDWVLAKGSTASEYAGLLLDIAKALPALPLSSLATVSMARRSQLEGRLLAILDPLSKRYVFNRIAVILTSLLTLVLIVPLAAMRPVTVEKTASEQFVAVTESEDQTETSGKTSHANAHAPSSTIHESLKVNDSSQADSEPLKKINIEQKGSTSSSYKKNNNQTQSKQSYQTSDALVIQSLCETLKDPILGVRIQAAETLARMKNPRAVPALISAFQDDNWEMRIVVASALGDIEDRSAVSALEKGLEDPNWQVRIEAAEALGEIGEFRSIPALSKTIQDDNRNVRLAAVNALDDLDAKQSIKPLLQALKDRDWEVRKEAAYALSDMDDPSIIQPLSDALNDSHWEVRLYVIHALGETEDPRAVESISRVLQDERWEIRKEVAEALGEIEDPSAIKSLSTLIHDDHAEVRRVVAWALGEIDNPQATDGLISLANDTQWQVRVKAVEALGEIEDFKAVPTLINRLNDGNPDVRKESAWALGEIGSRQAVVSLIKILDDTEWEVRKYAAWALGEIGDSRAQEKLTAMLKDESQEVRQAAAKALGEMN